ncbi:hypothetical protein LPB72_06775 [Hydrogenophaga crassostreae]|uniref:Uncharacterized protein n=1 Tax=Hydrogenophaga crassostreae TaxID=1763535 RepID=A0A167IEH2_9BURK|nr:hypothetical protein [Hydrogenophaga crassostreae]AOW13234.1 hypothetical protein LPB072_10600 [Hydrogenophaga crassostreae]OAD42618.1 hypothetical protein LPB72_06775 [Hydrogenophaga crassostreae]
MNGQEGRGSDPAFHCAGDVETGGHRSVGLPWGVDDVRQKIDQAIEDKVEATQKKLTAEPDLERIKVKAESALAKARRKAEALKAKRLEIMPDLLQLTRLENEADAIKKWNGQMPQVTGGGAPLVQIKP